MKKEKNIDIEKNNCEHDLEKNNNTRIKNIEIFSKVLILSTLAVIVVKDVKYEKTPIRITAKELMADSGLIVIKNETLSGNMTDQELLDYIVENGLTKKQIEEAIVKLAREPWCNQDEDETLEKIQKDKEELFNKLK